MQVALLEALNAARRARRVAVAITYLADGRSQLVVEGQSIAVPLDKLVSAVIRSGKAATVDVAGESVFLNVHLPPPRIVVIGAVHISQALAQMAPIAGYDLTIIDPRTAFATEERFPGVDLVPDWPEDALRDRPLDAYTALAALTHDPKIDDLALSEALKAGCFYIGALGSRKTHVTRIERLRAMGRTAEEIDRIAAPIGLDIRAANPAEIALATLTEVVQAFRRRALDAEG